MLIFSKTFIVIGLAVARATLRFLKPVELIERHQEKSRFWAIGVKHFPSWVGWSDFSQKTGSSHHHLEKWQLDWRQAFNKGLTNEK